MRRREASPGSTWIELHGLDGLEGLDGLDEMLHGLDTGRRLGRSQDKAGGSTPLLHLLMRK